MADASNPVVWTPSPYDLTKSSIARFRDTINSKYELSLRTYQDIHAWSVDPTTAGDFWITLFDFLEMGASEPSSRAFEGLKRDMFPTPVFFPGVRMNFAGSILQGRDHSAVALYEATEGRLKTRAITWGEICHEVEALAGAMRTHGVAKGDRIAAVIDSSALAIALNLATLSIGAIWSSISPDFGAKGIVDRLLQVDPTIVFTDTSIIYNGKVRDLSNTIRSWAARISTGKSLKNIVLHSDQPSLKSEIRKAIDLDAFVALGRGRALKFEQLPFSHPGFIFFSSGTTGPPKCILHSAGGLMLQVKKDYMMQIDLGPTDLLFQYTTTAWIMWAFLLTSLSIGCQVVVYRGSPVFPNTNFLPELLSHLRVTVFGTSAKYLTDLMDKRASPRVDFDLSSLRKVTSTGSVLPSDVAQWFYAFGFPRNVHLISGSGGTDCACSFVTGNPLTPVHADEISGKSLGMAVDAFDSLDAQGRSIANLGEPGELVCTQPFPSQPLTFWGPKGAENYKKAYFSMFTGVWIQGDLIQINPKTNGVRMLGRSDGVLNPAGVRFGSAEIYNVIRLFPEVEDSICTGQRRPQDRDESVILFLKLKAGQPETTFLKKQICTKIGEELSKRHIPKYVFYVDHIPYSNVGKKLELLVKNIISGRNIDTSVVANPESITIYRRFFHIESASKLDSVQTAPKL